MIKHNLDYNNENVYIGSCCNFARRKCGHKSDCNNPSGKNYNIKLYQTIRANGGWDNWVMIKLCEYKCESKYELNLEERRVIDEYKAKLNIYVPSRTTKEWYEDNKEEQNEKMKIYYEEHKEQINEYNKKWRENNKEDLNKYFKKYHENNKEERNEKHKKWYENNKEKLSEKITCECGAIVTKNALLHHRKSLKHISFLNNMKAN